MASRAGLISETVAAPPTQADTTSRASLFATPARLVVVGVYWRAIAGGLIVAVTDTDTCPRSGWASATVIVKVRG